ncbi:hypothetical protein, partial [Burkholderia ubonensis]|uniref:hypothetical protein n=1 Tax=Burkholderia ubonensis TaxID=101571 RepID=UPI001E4F26E7
MTEVERGIGMLPSVLRLLTNPTFFGAWGFVFLEGVMNFGTLPLIRQDVRMKTRKPYPSDVSDEEWSFV